MDKRIKYTDEFLKDYVLQFVSDDRVKGCHSSISSKDIRLNPNVVRVICRRFGWTNFLTKLGLRLSNKELGNKIKQLYVENGLSTRKIGQQLGYDKATIINWLNRMGIEMRTNKDYDLVKWDREPNRFIDNTKGYVMIRFPGANQAIPEHRLIMEQKLGRKLEPHEIVHHLNAIKSDNREENLVVVTRPTHPLGSKDTYKGMLQTRIRELEKEVEHLKSLLPN